MHEDREEVLVEFRQLDHDKKLEHLLLILLEREEKLMATVQDFVTAAGAFFDRMDTAVADIQADIENLDKQIADLTAQLGQLSPADQAALDAVTARVGGLADKVDALDALTPPVAPPVPAA